MNEEIRQRTKWFMEDRFGMFIHWGVYSSLGCSWNGKKYGGYGEHIQRMARIPVEVYKEKVQVRSIPKNLTRKNGYVLPKKQGWDILSLRRSIMTVSQCTIRK